MENPLQITVSLNVEKQSRTFFLSEMALATFSTIRLADHIAINITEVRSVYAFSKGITVWLKDDFKWNYLLKEKIRSRLQKVIHEWMLPEMTREQIAGLTSAARLLG